MQTNAQSGLAAAVGTIKMRSPHGYKSTITVSRTESGAVDIHFSRTTEGEALMRLPAYAAKELARLLTEATDV